MTLTPFQIRVLGALIEKEITTPDTYPLSINALQAACNQRSSRDPVLDMTEDDIRTALHGLEDLSLAGPARGSLHAPAGRVSKFEHHARTALHLRRDEIAVMCLLLLRGPQTPGELRSRADRLYAFDDLAAVLATLERLASAGGDDAAQGGPAAANTTSPERPLVQMLARQPGSREARFKHLLGGGAADPGEIGSGATASGNRGEDGSGQSRSELESRVAELEVRVAELERRLSATTRSMQSTDGPATH